MALAFVAATIARLGASDATLMLAYEQGAVKILVASSAFITCMYYFDLYDSSILGTGSRAVKRRASGLVGLNSLCPDFLSAASLPAAGRWQRSAAMPNLRYRAAGA